MTENNSNRFNPAHLDDIDIQDRLDTEHPEFDHLYQHVAKAIGKDPTPAKMISRFRDEYPELYSKTISKMENEWKEFHAKQNQMEGK